MRTSCCFMIATACMLAACSRPDPQASAAPSAALEEAVTSRAAPPSAPAQSAPAAAPVASERVAMPAPEALSDAAITGRIENALRSDPAMSGADVSINTDRGVVVLSGTVKSHEQTGVASAHAQRQDGVLRVDNHLMPALS